jgi:hypothetical protein
MTYSAREKGPLALGSHGVVGHQLPWEPLLVTELCIGVGTQVLEAVVRVAIVPEIGVLDRA